LPLPEDDAAEVGFEAAAGAVPVLPPHAASTPAAAAAAATAIEAWMALLRAPPLRTLLLSMVTARQCCWCP
jgi:hypothetical protein